MEEKESIESASHLDLINRLLDKGIAVNAWIRASLVGIELIAIEAKVILTLVETYLNYTEKTLPTTKSSKKAPQSNSYSY